MKEPLPPTVTGTISFKVGGDTLDMTVTLPAEPVKPYRMLPLFQKMTSTLVDMAVSETEEAGKQISCKKGCGACCRQLVPLAEIEAHQLAELVEQMPEPERTHVKQRFDAACSHFAEIGWFDQLSSLERESGGLASIGMDYFRQGVACPFLVDESCSIHADRPVACREYLVTSPSENCASPSALTIKMVDLPLRPSRHLMRLGQTRKIVGTNFIPMILALKWVEKHPDTFAEKTGERWMADFFQDLTGAALPDQA